MKMAWPLTVTSVTVLRGLDRTQSSMDHDYGSDSGKVNLQLSKIDGAEGPKLEIKLTMTRQALRCVLVHPCRF